jgi:hypothetical protein
LLPGEDELTNAIAIEGKNSTRSAVSGSLIISASQDEVTATDRPNVTATAAIAAVPGSPVPLQSGS